MPKFKIVIETDSKILTPLLERIAKNAHQHAAQAGHHEGLSVTVIEEKPDGSEEVHVTVPAAPAVVSDPVTEIPANPTDEELAAQEAAAKTPVTPEPGTPTDEGTATEPPSDPDAPKTAQEPVGPAGA